MVWWDAGDEDEDEEIHGMRAGIGGENSKATQPKQSEEMHKSFLNHVSLTLGDRQGHSSICQTPPFPSANL